MAGEIAPRRLQGWKKKELRENRSEAGAPNAGRDCEGDGIDVPWGGDGRVKHFIPGGIDSSICQQERVEPFRGWCLRARAGRRRRWRDWAELARALAGGGNVEGRKAKSERVIS